MRAGGPQGQYGWAGGRPGVGGWATALKGGGGRAGRTVTSVGMDELDARVRAICDLNVAEAREYGGRHEYDGGPQDLSLGGGAAGGARAPTARGGGAPRAPHEA